jgi:hypothetical protein
VLTEETGKKFVVFSLLCKAVNKARQTHVIEVMRYIDFLWMMDVLYRYYPKYHSSDLVLLADDILKWFNNELPEDSSALMYLRSCFDSPYDAIRSIWKELLLLSAPWMRLN